MKNTKIFKEEVFNLVGNEYSVLGEYKKAMEKLLMKHNTCGNEYYVKPNGFLNGSRCPKCYGNNKKTTKIFKEEVFNLVGNEYSVLGEYINSDTNLLLKHNTCGNEYYVKPYNFINTKCPKCYGSHKKTTEIFKEEVFNLVGNEYSVLGEYINTNSKILVKHNTCGNEYYVSPNSFLNNSNRCPKCKESKGEKMKLNICIMNM